MTMQMTESSTVSHPRLRSVVAVVAGFATVVALSMGTDAVLHSTGIYPPLDQPQGTWTLVVALIYRTVFTIAGGYVTALLAPRNGLRHAVILGAFRHIFRRARGDQHVVLWGALVPDRAHRAGTALDVAGRRHPHPPLTQTFNLGEMK